MKIIILSITVRLITKASMKCWIYIFLLRHNNWKLQTCTTACSFRSVKAWNLACHAKRYPRLPFLSTSCHYPFCLDQHYLNVFFYSLFLCYSKTNLHQYNVPYFFIWHILLKLIWSPPPPFFLLTKYSCHPIFWKLVLDLNNMH